MKKFLAIFLALMMVLSVCLVACADKKKPIEDDDDWEGEDTYNPLGTGTTDTTGFVEDGDDDDNSVSSGTWIDKPGTVYVGIDGTNLREGPGKSYRVAKQVSVGTALVRVQTNGNWDKVTYDNVEYYVDSDLVTVDGDDFNFGTDLTEEVILTVNGTHTVNLRTTPFYSDDFKDANTAISGLNAANTTAPNVLKKLAVSVSGDWYKVSYTGTIGEKTYTNAVFYLAASSVKTYNYVTDPQVPFAPNGGNQGIG